MHSHPVVLVRPGNLLWGTIKRSEIEAQEAHDRFNSDATGESMGEAAVPLEIRLTKPVQYYILREMGS